MAKREPKLEKPPETDMTPMIDMTFQLIIFFMVLINFSEAEADDRVTLPGSELAKPPEGQYMIPPITLQITKEGEVIYSGDKLALDLLPSVLEREKTVIDRRFQKEGGTAAAVVVLRADAVAKTGDVQRAIKICQEIGFQNFALRAKEEVKR